MQASKRFTGTRVERGESVLEPRILDAWERQVFNERELADLTLAIVAINGWNRLNIALRTVPGTYQPAPSHAV